MKLQMFGAMKRKEHYKRYKTRHRVMLTIKTQTLVVICCDTLLSTMYRSSTQQKSQVFTTDKRTEFSGTLLRHFQSYHLGKVIPNVCIILSFLFIIHDKKWSRGRFFTYAQGSRVNAACTAASTANNYT